MKQAYKAKSGIIFYIASRDGYAVTLRNPMTGEVKTIRDTTLARSYKLLTEEELKMENNVTNATDVAETNAINYKELLDCTTKGEFEERLDPVISVKGFEDITTSEDYAMVKKLHSNAVLCFRENLVRFTNAVPEYNAVKAELDAHPEDLDIVKSFQLVETALQKFANKMVFHLSKILASKERMDALKAMASEEESTQE